MKITMEKIISLAKRRGFIFPGSEIYGGLANTWDYGPLGTLLKRNLENAWWQEYVERRTDMVGLESAILMNPKVWEASGHVQNFVDPLVECQECRKRFRADHLKESESTCPACGGVLGSPREFNLLMKTWLGPVEDTAHQVYLRGETAQGIFINFSLVQSTMRRRLPFGIAQIGKAFRNEITPHNFIFRTREFTQMEIEWFCEPPAIAKKKRVKQPKIWFKEWVEERFNWYQRYGIKKENLRLRPHDKDELAHYAQEATDVEYRFPFGWSELEGIANRTDYDLKQHTRHSGRDLSYYDDELKQRYLPYVIEPSAGSDRSLLAFLTDAYQEEEAPTAAGDTAQRIVLKLNPKLAPIKVAIMPLLRNKAELTTKARAIHEQLKRVLVVMYDESGSIGRRYRRQDEAGTPFVLTVDFQTLKDDTVTVRDRDSLKQERVLTKELLSYLQEQLAK